MKTTIKDTPATMVKKFANEIARNMKTYIDADKRENECRNAAEWDNIQATKGAAASDAMLNLQQMLSELGCVLSIEGICGATEYYTVEKKSF
jgi:hypothetical protein